MTAFRFKSDRDLQALTFRELHDEAERTMRMIRSTVSDKASGCFERYLHRILTICIEYSEPDNIMSSDQNMQDWMNWEGKYEQRHQ